MKTAPDPIYVQEFLFKQSNTSQIFDLKTPAYIPTACNLLVADKKRGLLYVGHDDKITVLKPAEENNAKWKIELQLPGVISKIAINCDYNYIAVAVALKPTIFIYDANSLVRNILNLLLEITSSNNLDSYVMDIRWNPTVPTMLCTVTSNCTIGSFQIKVDEEARENSVPKISVLSKISNEPQALCAAWSPKGKQVAVGCRNGDIVQLKPDTLKVARTIAGPLPSIGEVISILWISNYQFCAAYLNSERHTNVLIIDAPKGEVNATFTCYEDITYGFPDAEGEGSVLRYYFEHVPEWGLIIAGSSTSSEIAVLGTIDGGANWNQWQLVDSGRAQLPLMRTTEIYPMGLAVDKSPTNKLPWGTESTLPHPVPILHILGTSGQLCSFHMVNLAPNCPAINVRPTEIITAPIPLQPSTLSTEVSFTMNSAVTSTPRPKQPEIVPERSKTAPMTNIFGDSLKAAGFFQQPVEQPTIQPKLQEEKTAPLVITKPVVSKETVLEPTKTETKSVVIDKEASSPQVIEQKASIDDGIRMRAYLQEQVLFEKELRNRLESQVWECGTDEEKKRLGETSAVIEQFLRDLKDTTNSLSSDIAYLKALLLQSFAWVEETKSKNAATTDITGRNCNDNSKIAELQRCYYYTQTQLNQVSKILDLEWSDHKAQQRSKMKIPSLEYVYQNLLIHNKIIMKEKEKLEKISRRWKSHNRSAQYTTGDISSLNRSMVNLHLNSHEKSSTVRKTDVIDVHCKTIASRTLSFTREKQIKLKALLTDLSSPRTIKPENPSPIQDRLKATLSSLASLSPAVTEAKTKTEPPIVKQSTVVKQQTVVEKQIKPQNPLASLNSIVARIGSSDTNNSIVTQNKTTQQKPLPATVSFSPAMSVKQTDKKPILTAASITSQSKPKQDLNVNFPSSITFGTPALKAQDTIFPKSPIIDATIRSNKESTINDSIPKVAESALASTGILKDVLSTEYPLVEAARIGITRNLPSLSVAPAVKTDAAATFSFANAVPSVTKNSSSGIALDTATLSFAYAKPPVEPSAPAVQTPLQTPIDFSILSLTLQPTNSNNNVDGKINTIATSPSFAALAPVITTQAPTMTAVTPITTIGGLTISIVDPSIAQRKSMEVPSINPVTIEKITTSEAKALNFGSIATQVPPTSLSATSIFGGQALIKSALPEMTSTTLPATTTNFGAVAFPSITPTFGTSTPASTASVFSGFASNTSAGITIASSSATSVSSSTPAPFQSSLNKPTFGESTVTSISATSFGINPNSTSAGTIPFGIPTATTSTTTMTTTVAATAAAVSITPAFGKNSPIASPVSNAQFPNVQISSPSAMNVFGKPIINPASTPFGNSPSSVFSNVPAPTSSNTSIFGGNSMNSIFGSAPLSPSGNIFGGNAFGTSASPSGSVFDTGTPKSGIMFGGATNTSPTISPFGGATSNASPLIGTSANTNVFRSTMPNTSPIQQPVLGGNQAAFGQASTFGTKPVFGSSPIFGGSKPVFGSSFGSAPTFESPGIGFGSASVMQGGSTMENMPKVFGEVSGSSTFESLANQSGGLSFGSLAQKNPEPEKPTFTAGSSFSSWR
ncbi:LOW QUALITY PROTEIN: nuclear pore complex protein Nup214 [Nylanderia fulva]|uniref:LOW QUALITY PROTEIN: nuclear pore complex protein Nup214 n=1 Tax=Nylanderia fulva TaxID=613905 RepID=UPI0010FAD136|nr:LOW QUALITY PROTEIN: nuclear pore complex protein Nup214 [Nylanderia fulva]